jgi:hypothetical protein
MRARNGSAQQHPGTVELLHGTYCQSSHRAQTSQAA